MNGLGDRFLAHVERCSSLIHLDDITQDDPFKSYKILRKELACLSKYMEEKPENVF